MADSSCKTEHHAMVLDLEEIRAKRATPAAALLRDTHRVAAAIRDRTCVLCGQTRTCVTRAGVCLYCYEQVLSPEEQKIARDEARHKIVTLQVSDDRWPE